MIQRLILAIRMSLYIRTGNELFLSNWQLQAMWDSFLDAEELMVDEHVHGYFDRFSDERMVEEIPQDVAEYRRQLREYLEENEGGPEDDQSEDNSEDPLAYEEEKREAAMSSHPDH